MHPACGTRAAYHTGCRCIPCRAANATYQTGYRRLRAQGKTPLGARVSAKDVARRLYELKAEGYKRYQLARALGLKRPIVELHTGPGAKITMRNLLRLKRLHRLLLSESGDQAAQTVAISLRLRSTQISD